MTAILSLRENISRHGWSLVEFRGNQNEYLQFASQFGKPRASRLNGPLVDRLSPLSQHESKRNSMSAAFGLGAFPFHTDAAYFRIPPRYMLLRMAGSSACERHTLVKDFGDVIASGMLRRDVWLVNGGRDRFYTPIVDEDIIAGRLVFRFDPCCMRPVHDFFESERVVQDAIQQAKDVAIKWAPGLLLILDNWRVLHARGEAPQSDDSGRLLERVLIDESLTTDSGKIS